MMDGSMAMRCERAVAGGFIVREPTRRYLTDQEEYSLWICTSALLRKNILLPYATCGTSATPYHERFGDPVVTVAAPPALSTHSLRLA